VSRSLAELEEFVRTRTALVPVPLLPEITLHLATDVMPLWHATSADLAGWDDSPFWAFAWPGGQALARHVLDRPEEVRGRTVIDFGTGSGLVAIAAALAGAARVVAWDVDPFCETAVRLNAAANGVALEFRAGSPLGLPAPGVEVVLAGDVFYERALAADFLAWGARLAADGVRVLAGDPGRIYSPREGLEDLAAYDVPTSLATEDRVLMRTWVLRLPPPPRPPT
jgi:predicted nicotinamide N-methyase